MVGRARRGWLLLGGVLVLALALFVVPISVEGARGPTRLLGTLGHIWELLATVAAVVLVVGMTLILRLLPRSTALRVLTVLTTIAFAGNAVTAALRLARLVEVELPLAWWLPAIVLLHVWAWVAAGTAQRAGLMGPGPARAVLVIALAEVVVVGLSLIAVLSTDGSSPVVNILAGLASGVLWAAFAIWWIALAFRWRAPAA